MMDKQHKEELQQNDLKEFLTHFDRFVSKHGKSLVVFILLIAAVIFVSRWYRTKDLVAQESAWADIAAATTPASLEIAAQTHADLPGAASFALLSAADQLYFETVVGTAGDVPDATNPRLSPEKLKKLSDRVVPLYQQVIDAPQAHETSLYRLNARLGLAATLTTLGEFDEAGEQYDLVIEEAGSFKVLATHAEFKKKNLKELTDPIVFQAPKAPLPDLIGPLGTPLLETPPGNFAPTPAEQPTTAPTETPAPAPAKADTQPATAPAQ